MWVYEAKEWVSKAKWAFQQVKSYANAAIKEVITLDKKFK